MSEWTKIRDSIVTTLKVDEVTEELKTKVTKAILDDVLPTIEESVDAFCEKLKEQAAKETGWCRIRDGIVLPCVLEGLVYVVRVVLAKALEEKK